MKSTKYTFEVSADRGFSNVGFREVWKYRDLILLLVKRDFKGFYKQTVLGPFWFFVQPLLSSVVYWAIMNAIGVSGPFMFFLGGVTLWGYFRDVFTKVAKSFITNQSIFGKVYFPRVVYPISVALSSFLRLIVQFILFIVVWAIQYSLGDIKSNETIFLFPICILMIAILAIGLGMLVSALTAKYKDFQFLIDFGMQLLMFGSFVVIPVSSLLDGNERYISMVFKNPILGQMETFRHGFIDCGIFDVNYFIYSCIFCLVSFPVGLFFFNRTEKSFIDTV